MDPCRCRASEKVSHQCKRTSYGHLFLPRYDHSLYNRLLDPDLVNIDFKDIIDIFPVIHRFQLRIYDLLDRRTYHFRQ
mgnify:CR=1 FL=1